MFVATRMTIHIHRYVPYEMRPRYTIGLSDSSDFAASRSVLSSAISRATVPQVAANPRPIGPSPTHDVPTKTTAKRLSGATTRSHVRVRCPDLEQPRSECQEGAGEELVRARASVPKYARLRSTLA